MKRLMALALCLCLLLCGCKKPDGAYVPTGDALLPGEGDTGTYIPNLPETDPTQLKLAYYPARSLNPYLCTDYTNRTLFTLLYQSLFTTDRDYVTRPMLCKRYTVSEDAKTYTVYLENATFSDGAALTVEDVVASMTAARESDYYGGRFLHITEVKPSADGGVTFLLDTAYEDLPLILDIPIVKASQVAEDRPLGTGPYALYTATGGESLRKRTNWWCSHIALPYSAETITLSPAESTTQIRDSFEFFGLNLVCADPGSDRYADYRCDYELFDCENGIFLYLATSRDSKVFKNDPVRVALTYAVNRDLLVEEYYRGFARSATLPASPLSPYYNKNLAERYKYNDMKFLEAIQNADLEGSTIVFLANSDDSLRLRVARRIGDMLEACGLEVEMKELGGTAYTDAIKTRQYDIYLGQTRLSPNMDLSAFFDTYGQLSWGGVNDTGAYNLCLQALENHGNYFTLHKQVMDQGLICPVLFRSYAIFASRGRVSNIEPTRDSIFYYSSGRTLADAKG